MHSESLLHVWFLGGGLMGGGGVEDVGAGVGADTGAGAYIISLWVVGCLRAVSGRQSAREVEDILFQVYERVCKQGVRSRGSGRAV
jgi:hypothetical protein